MGGLDVLVNSGMYAYHNMIHRHLQPLQNVAASSADVLQVRSTS